MSVAETDEYAQRAPVSRAFVFVYMREVGYYILYVACRNEGNRCETAKDN